MALDFAMQREGYISRLLTDGETALGAVAESASDLIRLDLILPGLW